MGGYAVAQPNDIPAHPEEIRVRVSPHGIDARDVGAGEAVAPAVEPQQDFAELEQPGIAFEAAFIGGHCGAQSAPSCVVGEPIHECPYAFVPPVV